MTSFDLIIHGGRVVTAADIFQADIGVRDGKIVALADSLTGADEEIDARGHLVLPGGVDAHCHLDQPSTDGSVMADDFPSGTRSAACGGTTTILPFAIQMKGQSLANAVVDYHRRAAKGASIDYGFHIILTDPTESVIREEVPALVRSGYSSFKIYMTYDGLKLRDREILDVLDAARTTGALIMVHAENADGIGWLTDRLVAQGRTSPKEHAAARPVIVEREATHRAISFGELIDVPILLVHVSSGAAVEQIQWARGKGASVLAETCPQYIALTAADLDRADFTGAQFVCSPPPRDRTNQDAIWSGLATGAFDVFSSDHAPFNFDDPHGKKLHGDHAHFGCIPNGIPGLETRLPILFSEGVVKGRISLQQFVALSATNPARIYGLYPRKGTIAVGSDADIAIWDPGKRTTIRNRALHHACDYTPYEGREIEGWPVTTISRGRTLWRDGQLHEAPEHGRFIARGLPDIPRLRSSLRPT